MRITVLGCWSPYPRAGGACSGYVVQDGAANVIIDLGSGSFSRLSSLFDYKAVGAVILTHLHPDHCSDIECLKYALEGAMRDGRMRQGRIPLLLPGHPAELAAMTPGSGQKAFEKIFIEELPLEVVPPGVEARVFNMGPLKYYFLPTEHSLPSYAVGVEGSGYFVYSGDTAPTENLALFARRADIFLCEASGLDSDGYLGGVHMTARQAGELARKAEVKELIITHFWPEYNLEELRGQAQEGYGKKVEIATEGDTYFVY